MCQRIECSNCNKPTYSGCGRHVEQVLGDVPKDERCKCREKGIEPKATGFLERFFGKV